MVLSWNHLLRALRVQRPELYRAWFDELAPGTLDAGVLEIRVPDAARAQYLDEHCRELLIHAAMELTGRLVTIRVVGPQDDAGVLTTGGAPPLTVLPLNPDYTFDEFVVGTSNRLAHAACRAICSQPGTLYNPVFIHGPSGLGKTHLLQAVCGELLQTQTQLRAAYVSCETFVNDYVRAIEGGTLQQFRDWTRSTDMLVVDDIQFLANRESCQEELFHTFNVLYQARRQIILSADCSPADIPTLQDRLKSRFNWGLVAQIDPPNRETRHAILQKKARLRGCDIPEDVLDFVAERVDGNIRLLEGALTKLLSACQVNQWPTDLEHARHVFEGYNGQHSKALLVDDILRVVSEHFNVRPSELLSRRRSRSIAYPRQVGMYLARRLTPLSLEEIGARFGGRDHSTVLHADRVIDHARHADRETAETLTALTRRLMIRR